MVGIFDRWFTKNKKTDEADLIIGRSLEGARAQAEAHQSTWGFGTLDRWDVDLTEGLIRFSSNDGFLAVAPVQVVGTFNTLDSTFLWAWDHPSIPSERAIAAQLARDFGEKYGLVDYTNRKVDCDEVTAWEYAAVTNHVANMQGVYRAPSGKTLAFFVFGQVSLSNTSKE